MTYNTLISDAKARLVSNVYFYSEQEMEHKVTVMVDKAFQMQVDKLNRLKSECRQGFASVHESITNSKGVLEGKLTLSEEQLRKEISHVKNLVVLV